MKKTLALGAAVSTLFVAGAAMATNQAQVESVALIGSDTLQDTTVALSGNIPGYGAYSENALAGAFDIQLNGAYVVAFCDDLFDPLATEFGFSVVPGTPYTYAPGPLTTASLGDIPGISLTTDQVNEISGLVGEGTLIAVNSPNNYEFALPAIQAAIWHVEYGVDATFANTAGGAIEATDYANYIAQTFAGPPNILSLTNGSDGTNVLQSLVAVPEPASWALMLIGLGALGGVVRQRRAVAQA